MGSDRLIGGGDLNHDIDGGTRGTHMNRFIEMSLSEERYVSHKNESPENPADKPDDGQHDTDERGAAHSRPPRYSQTPLAYKTITSRGPLSVWMTFALADATLATRIMPL